MFLKQKTAPKLARNKQGEGGTLDKITGAISKNVEK